MPNKETLYHLISETYEMVVANIHPKVLDVINEIDLEGDLKVIEALIKQIDLNEISENVINISINNVQDTISLIKDELSDILKEVETHKERYFAQYRDPYFQTNLNNLIKHKKILDKRVDFFIKLLSLHKHRKQHESLIQYLDEGVGLN